MQKSNRDTFNEILEISYRILLALFGLLIYVIFIMLFALCIFIMTNGPITPFIAIFLCNKYIA